MKDNQDGLFSKKWFNILVSLLLALLLCFYVDSGKNSFSRQNTENSPSPSISSGKTMTIKMPLELRMNSRRYVVSGYPQYVKVNVTGPSALVKTVSNTQNFRVYANLNGLKPGKHTVKLRTSGLNTELKARIDPKQITVNLQRRATITKKVQVQLSSRSVNGNYTVGTPSPSMSTVQVTGAKNQVKKVARVIAFIEVPRNATSSLHRQVTLQAVDKKGRTVNVVVMPSSINVTVPISGNGEEESSSATSRSSSSSASSAAASSTNENSQSTAMSASSSSSNNE